MSKFVVLLVLTNAKKEDKLKIMLCKECPRKCNVNRLNNLGFCSCPEKIILSKYMLHHWEEPIISGSESEAGSGAIFFGGCNLKCAYCQNEDISFSPRGEALTPKQLSEIFKILEAKGALNINLVTPTHYLEQIIQALNIYRPQIPIIWNSSGYETAEQIKKLKKYIDIYLVDLKYMDEDLAKRLSKAKNYPQFARESILQMKQNQPNDIIINGLMKKGVIIRHLVLPNCIENSFRCLDWIKENFGKNQYISVMSQYTPNKMIKANSEYKFINRRLHIIEYKRVINHINKLGFKNGFLQDLTSSENCYLLNFSSDKSK